jgi:hypothetical protein
MLSNIGWFLFQAMKFPCIIQAYFLKLKPLGACTAHDGNFIGNMVVDVAEAANQRELVSAVCAFVLQTAMLRECELASFGVLLSSIFHHHFAIHAQAVATTNPAALTAAEAEIIGRGFETIIRLSPTPADAVDELLSTYPALGVVEQRHAWVRPMLETIAKRRLANAPLGLKLRLGIGAGFSTADMVSDIYSIIQMVQSGQAFGAYGMISLVGTSLALQLLLSVTQNKHRPLSAVAWNMVLVLSLAKPGVDAMNVASGTERIAGAPFDPFNEMIIGKMIETATEGVLGAALQAYIVLSGHSSIAAVLSVGISCISTGFTASLMAFNIDTSPANRKKDPAFFGYIPNGRRVLVFVELFIFHSTHAVLRTFVVALLARTNWHWLVAYMAADLCVFIVYKIARGDLIYYPPGAAGSCVCAQQLVYCGSCVCARQLVCCWIKG